MSYLIKSDLSVKKVDGVVSGILTLLVEALVLEDRRASYHTILRTVGRMTPNELLGRIMGTLGSSGLKQTSWDGISQKHVPLFRNLKQKHFKCKINNVKKIIMNSYLKSKRSDICEHVLIYRIILNWNMTTGRSFTAIQRAACANTHPEVEWWYGSTTSS